MLNLYVVARITNNFLPFESHILITVLIAIGTFIFQSLGLLGEMHLLLKVEQKINSKKLVLFVYRSSFLMFGALSCFLFYTIFIDIIWVFLRLLLSTSSPIYIYFNNYNLLIISTVTFVTVVLGFIVTIKGPVVEKIEILLKNLPKSFDGFTIVQISDLHVGSTIKNDYVTKVVNIANSLKPNIIALTGDFVDGHVEQLKNDVAPLSKLKSTHGNFSVTGNHEYYSGAKEWIEEFTNLGIRNLSNEHALIKNNNEQIILAGVTDYSTINQLSEDASSPSKALKGAPSGLTKILLAHQPSSYLEAYKAGFDLQLSGHTHAGQYFPFTLLIRFFHRYYAGLNQHLGMWIYINRGTGHWGPPLRLAAPAEITLIILKVDKG